MKYQSHALIQLCEHILPNDSSLAKDIHAYFQHDNPISSRHIQNEPWFILIEGLIRRKRIVLNPLLQSGMIWVIRKGKWNAQISKHSQMNTSASRRHFIISLSQSVLQDTGYVLCELIPTHTMHSPMTLLQVHTAKICQAFAQESGYGNILIHSDQAYSDTKQYIS
ncbi:hypothetical protein IC619_016165 [Hazenella sp. IB182353]|uniref:hypothetical protein n=1 Tax=Polycladospora coralii TaxID=2771432 RepID=UPI0017465EE5|nr:hypothetical protein [Polycladospora coralii]MBS7531988.1 hypothetical protein [Polycladospora coralii]